MIHHICGHSNIYAVHSVGVPLEKSCVLTRGTICSRAGQFSVTARDSCRNIMKEWQFMIGLTMFVAAMK